jgi:hypothetical protein
MLIFKLVPQFLIFPADADQLFKEKEDAIVHF